MKLKLDKMTNATVTIGYEHHEIHDGDSFSCHYSNDCTNIGEMTLIAFNTPTCRHDLHLLFEASSTAGAYMAIYENSALDVGEGTALAIYNRNRNSSNASLVGSVVASPVIGQATSFNEAQAAGANLVTTTEIYRYYLGAAAAGTDHPGNSRGDNEWILKRGTQYAFAVVSLTADDNTHNVILHWYEHLDPL